MTTGHGSRPEPNVGGFGITEPSKASATPAEAGAVSPDTAGVMNADVDAGEAVVSGYGSGRFHLPARQPVPELAPFIRAPAPEATIYVQTASALVSHRQSDEEGSVHQPPGFGRICTMAKPTPAVGGAAGRQTARESDPGVKHCKFPTSAHRCGAADIFVAVNTSGPLADPEVVHPAPAYGVSSSRESAGVVATRGHGEEWFGPLHAQWSRA